MGQGDGGKGTLGTTCPFTLKNGESIKSVKGCSPLDIHITAYSDHIKVVVPL